MDKCLIGHSYLTFLIFLKLAEFLDLLDNLFLDSVGHLFEGVSVDEVIYFLRFIFVLGDGAVLILWKGLDEFVSFFGEGR
jgi:hypothetical protein